MQIRQVKEKTCAHDDQTNKFSIVIADTSETGGEQGAQERPVLFTHLPRCDKTIRKRA